MAIYEVDDNADLKDITKKIKISKFKKALIDTDGNISKAARKLNISRDTANRWIDKNPAIKDLIRELKKAKYYDDDDDYDD